MRIYAMLDWIMPDPVRVASPRLAFAGLESLESRQLLAASWTSGSTLYLAGDSNSANTLSVGYNASNDKLIASVNGKTTQYAKSGIRAINITGGSASDILSVAQGVEVRSTLIGNAGDDRITGGPWNDSIDGGAGNDYIFSGNGAEHQILGGDGNDTILGGTGNENVFAQAGNDFIDGGVGLNNYIDGGAGSDTATRGHTYVSVETIQGATTPTPTTPVGAGSPTPIGQGTNPIARITSISDTIPAGTAVHVEGISSTLNGGDPNDARYEWNFGDAGSKYNTLVGFTASHFYASAGTYTVTLRVINESGRTSTSTYPVTVTNANRQTYYVSNSGSDSNAGTSSASPWKTFEKVRATLENRSNIEILFEKGDTFAVNTGVWWKGSNIRMASYGSGSKPVLKWGGELSLSATMISTNTGTSNFAAEGLVFDSIYNDTSGTDVGMVSIFKPYGTNGTIKDSVFYNVGFALNANTHPTGVLFQDNSSPSPTGLRKYFGWIQGSNISFIGNTVANSTREHPIRISNATKVLLAYNNITNLDRRDVDQWDASKTSINVQVSSYVYVFGNTVRAPLSVGPLGVASAGLNTSDRTRYVVVENNTVLDSQLQILHGAEKVTVRNNVLTNDEGPAISIEGWSTTFNRGVNDVAILNNTGVNNATYGNFLRLNGEAANLQVLNNLYLAPNYQVGAYGSSPVQVFDNDLSSFTRIDHNVWPITAWNTIAQGGSNWINTNGGTYYSAAGWNNLAQVGTDYYEDPSYNSHYEVASSSFAASGALLIGAVFTDFDNAYRPSDDWSVGAVQV